MSETLVNKNQDLSIGDLNLELHTTEIRIADAMSRALHLVALRNVGIAILDFDIRGELYDLALTFAPHARAQDIDLMMNWLNLQPGESGVDIAAGTGYLTRPIVEKTNAMIYAIDPSKEQLKRASAISQKITPVCDTPDNIALTYKIPKNSLNFATSFGGIHHVEDQANMFKNVSALLSSGGRFVAADVCAETALSTHFDSVVARKCITGHTAKWLDEKKIIRLSACANLEVKRIERKALKWCFSSEKHAALFFKGLHAYDIPLEEIASDLKDTLGAEEMDSQFNVNWPMIIFDVRKP